MKTPPPKLASTNLLLLPYVSCYAVSVVSHSRIWENATAVFEPKPQVDPAGSKNCDKNCSIFSENTGITHAVFGAECIQKEGKQLGDFSQVNGYMTKFQ